MTTPIVKSPSGITASSTTRGYITISWALEDIYTSIELQYKVSVWHSFPLLSGTATSFETSVNDNTTYTFRVRGFHSENGYSDWSEEVTCTSWSSTVTDTCTGSTSYTQSSYSSVTNTVTDILTCTDSVTSGNTLTTTCTDTLTCTDLVGSSQTIKTDYAYYLGSSDGKIYRYSTAYNGDAGEVIICSYKTKDTDFTDQDGSLYDILKTVWAVKLHYEDVYASTPVIVGISTDGGLTWTTQQQSLGTGNGKAKNATFFFHITGQTMMFSIESGSASTDFKWTALEIEYEPAGQHWSVG